LLSYIKKILEVENGRFLVFGGDCVWAWRFELVFLGVNFTVTKMNHQHYMKRRKNDFSNRMAIDVLIRSATKS
jgi:hypothetical protein